MKQTKSLTPTEILNKGMPVLFFLFNSKSSVFLDTISQRITTNFLLLLFSSFPAALLLVFQKLFPSPNRKFIKTAFRLDRSKGACRPTRRDVQMLYDWNDNPPSEFVSVI